jgi:hypothetical protein
MLPLVSVSLASCKAGDSVTGFAPATADFVEEDSSGVTERKVSLATHSKDEGRIVLDVVVTEVDELVTGIAMKLTYDHTFAKFIDCEDGNLFPPGQCFFAEPGDGEVFLGRSVTGGSQATTVTGAQVIMRVEFLVFGVTDGTINIEGQNLGGGDASALLDINGDPILVQWFSGTLRGT